MYIEILAIPTTSLIKNLGHLSTGEVCRENNLKAAVELIDASLHLFGEDSTL